jgi:hypothetical protein
MTITSLEPRVTAIIDSRPISLMDTSATFSALPEFWGPTKLSSTSIVGVKGTPTKPLMIFSLTYILGDIFFTHKIVSILDLWSHWNCLNFQTFISNPQKWVKIIQGPEGQSIIMFPQPSDSGVHKDYITQMANFIL